MEMKQGKCRSSQKSDIIIWLKNRVFENVLLSIYTRSTKTCRLSKTFNHTAKVVGSSSSNKVILLIIVEGIQCSESWSQRMNTFSPLSFGGAHKILSKFQKSEEVLSFTTKTVHPPCWFFSLESNVNACPKTSAHGTLWNINLCRQQYVTTNCTYFGMCEKLQDCDWLDSFFSEYWD